MSMHAWCGSCSASQIRWEVCGTHIFDWVSPAERAMMKLTWISEYEAHPGEMFEWRLHPATIAVAGQLAADARPPSYMQAGHIRTATMLRDLGLEAPTWLGAVFDVPGT